MILRLFWTYLKIGTFTIGGGYVMLSYVQREIVDHRHWISEEEFMNMIALAQAAPGLLAVNTAIFVGWCVAKRHGLNVGMSIAASVLGAILPSIVIILAIALLFADYKQLPAVEAVFRGIRPAVVALIAAPLYRMARSAKISWATAAIPVAGTLLIWLAGLNPVWTILMALAGAMAYSYMAERRKG